MSTPKVKHFQVDPTERTWATVKGYIEHEFEKLQTSLAQHDSSREEDLIVKGQILGLRRLLSIAKPPLGPEGTRNGEPGHGRRRT